VFEAAAKQQRIAFFAAAQCPGRKIFLNWSFHEIGQCRFSGSPYLQIDGNRMTGSIYIGCAGWSVPRSEQARFPEQGSHLERYAAVFPAVEINSSFYRPHRPDTYARWRDSVPEAFRFSVKMPRRITHELRLQNSDEYLQRFLAEAGNLEQKLGCLLVQLPPSLRFDPLIAGRFFDGLCASVDVAIVCEARHASWFTAAASDMLTSFGIARVMADPPAVDQHAPAVHAATVYVRLHGSPVIYHSVYPDDYLIRLAENFAGELAAGRQAWCIFDNTASGAAVPNALSLLSRCHGGAPDSHAR
jgi:uncharacterized protein YecE (DUF72 family)